MDDPGPHVVVAGRRIPVVLPGRGDPRLHLAAVLLTVQVLGQTVLGFKLSIAQILATMGVCAVIEVVVTLRRSATLVWPASALLTGNSIALLLRATGTDHGDWWSLDGIHWFLLAAVLAMASKHLVRPGGRHRFNPSNVGIVWVLLVVGPAGVFPQYLWWGPWDEPPVLLATVVIVAGAGWVLREVGMVPMASAFLATFGTLIGVAALAGDGFHAIWHPVPVSGAFYWANVVLSPEVLIFVFFMMSDPQTAPRSPRGRILFAVLTAVVAAGLVVVQPTEFGVKVGILASLTVTCALVPTIERWADRGTATAPAPAPSSAVPSPAPGVPAWRRPAVLAVVIVAVAAPLNTLSLVDDEELILIERGLSGDPDPQ